MRDATDTSAPGYADAGPPVVAGPGPRDQGADELLTPTASYRTSARGSDLGPPTAPGPGPQYDYGSPGARRRP